MLGEGESLSSPKQRPGRTRFTTLLHLFIFFFLAERKFQMLARIFTARCKLFLARSEDLLGTLICFISWSNWFCVPRQFILFLMIKDVITH